MTTTIIIILAVLFVLTIAGLMLWLAFKPRYTVSVPGYSTKMGGEKVDPELVAKILDLWRKEWVAKFGGTDPKPMIDKQNLMWLKDPLQIYTFHAAGVCDDSTHIRLQVYNPLETSALIHELIHQHFAEVDGNPEPQHSGKWTQAHFDWIVATMQKFEQK